MCLFSLPIRHVSKTRIFARSLGQRQFLAYSMGLDADGDLAMVLPIPVPPKSSEDAVTFVDMSNAKNFFNVLDAFFPMELSRGGGFGAFAPQSAAKAILKVHDVGDFEASFVPTREDFDRLDARFRLSPDVWDALPQYADWGFCVFKLRGAPSPATGVERQPPGIVDRVINLFKKVEPDAPRVIRDFHPMAFELPRRDPSTLFFPTIHVHDGTVHQKAHYDHQLYVQAESVKEWKGPSTSPPIPGLVWETSLPLDPRMVASEARPFLDPDQPKAHRLTLIGDLPNQDLWVS